MFSSRTDLYDAHFDASWEIDVFGGRRRALQQANALVASAAEDRHDVLVSVLAEVARNYIEVRNFQQRLAITQKNIKAQQDAVDIARSRFNAGLPVNSMPNRPRRYWRRHRPGSCA